MANDKSDHRLWYLKEMDIYEGINESRFCELAPNSFEKKYPKDSQLYTPHEVDDKIYVVKQGEVILYHSREGKRAIFDTLGPGSVFGNFDPHSHKPTHFAQTTKSTLLCVTPVSEFLNVIREHPEAMLKLMQKMAMRIADYEHKIRTNIETATEKIYNELLRLKAKREHGFLGKFKVPLKVTHEQIAEYTNLNRVTVTRSLKKLREMGLVTIDKNSGSIELQEA